MLLAASPSSPSGLRCKVCGIAGVEQDPRLQAALILCGVLCQVADFGMSRELMMTAPLETATYGTVTHSALAERLPSCASAHVTC